MKTTFLIILLTIAVSISLFWLERPSMENSSLYAQDTRLMLRQETPHRSIKYQTGTSIMNTISIPGFFDQSRNFQSHMFSMVGEAWSVLSSSRALCLGAQTSVDRLYELVELVKNWSGPMSIAVFVPDIELGVGLRYIQYLRSCNLAIERQVSFHLIYPVEHQGTTNHPDLQGLDEVVGNMDCKQPKQVLKFLLNVRSKEMLAWRESYPYPQNLLRNLAKNGCQTNYTFIPDIDMVPTPGMDLHLETFLEKEQKRSNCSKCAYVIPTYEISHKTNHLPTNKRELLELLKRKQARQFHQTLYPINQKSSNLNHWERVPGAKHIDIAYKVKKYIFKYEPLYIARADTPEFDERFVGFGLTRNTQVRLWAYKEYSGIWADKESSGEALG